MRLLIRFVFAVFCLNLIRFEPIHAEEDSRTIFSDLIGNLKEEGTIPDTEGTTISFGSFEDALAKIGYSQGFPIYESRHFVISANVTWLSASTTLNPVTSGCGILFSAADAANHLMVSARLDGAVYITGSKNYEKMSFGRYVFGAAASQGGGNLTLIVDSDKATVYIDGNRIVRKADLPVMGSVIALTTLSGTNADFGTRCSWKDIFLYTWQD